MRKYAIGYPWISRYPWAPDLFQDFWGLPDWALGPNTPYIEMTRDPEKFRAWLRDVRDNPLPRYYLPRCWACQPAQGGEDGSNNVLPRWYIDVSEYRDGPDGYWEPEQLTKFWNIPTWAAGHNLPYLTMARHPEKFREWLAHPAQSRALAASGNVGEAVNDLHRLMIEGDNHRHKGIETFILRQLPAFAGTYDGDLVREWMDKIQILKKHHRCPECRINSAVTAAYVNSSRRLSSRISIKASEGPNSYLGSGEKGSPYPIWRCSRSGKTS